MISKLCINQIRNGMLTRIHSSLKTIQSTRCVQLNYLVIRSQSSDSSAKDKAQAQLGKLVYEGPLKSNIKLVKGFSLSTSALALAMQPMIWKEMQSLSLVTSIGIGGIIGFFMMGSPLLLHWLTSRYITQMYFNGQTKVFTASTVSFFLQNQQFSFRAEDVVIPSAAGALTTVKVKGKPVLFTPELFQDRYALDHLLGYDKPLDISLPPELKAFYEKQDVKSK